MGWLIAALGTGLAIGGTAAIYFGAPYIQVEWGYSEVIAGTTALSAGILAVALSAILFALRDLKRLATPRGDGVAIGPPILAEATDVAHGVAIASPPIPQPIHPEPPAAGPVAISDQAPTVVGRYEANGASYVLFSDGSIEVETETGTHRYASMQDLRAHIEQQEAG